MPESFSNKNKEETKMLKCKKCGTEVEKGTKVCPNCGKKIGGRKIVLKIIAGIFILSILGSIIEYLKMTPEQRIEKSETEIRKHIEETDNSWFVYELIQEVVKNSLKTPSTAKFPNKSEIKIIKDKEVYTIIGYVDAQNSFGAMIRTNYSASVKQIAKEDTSKSSYVINYCEFKEN